MKGRKSLSRLVHAKSEPTKNLHHVLTVSPHAGILIVEMYTAVAKVILPELRLAEIGANMSVRHQPVRT